LAKGGIIVKSNITVLGYSLLSRLCEQISAALALPYEVKILDIPFGKLGKLPQQLDRDEHVEVIIAASGHAGSLTNVSRTPVVEVEVTDYDLLNVIRMGLERGHERVAILRYGSKPSMLPETSLFKADVLYDTYLTLEEAAGKVQGIIQQGVTAIAGSSTICEMVERQGGEPLFLYTEEAIKQAFQRAVQMIQAKKLEYAKTEHLKTVLGLSRDAIISVDIKGRVTHANRKAEQFLGRTAGEMIGRPIAKLMPNTTLMEVVRTKQPAYNDYTTVAGVPVIGNRLPIIVQGEVVGAVASFQEVSAIEDAEQAARKSIHGKGHIARFTFADVIGASDRICQAVRLAKHYAQSDATVLLIGQTGTGKELFAQSIHNGSRRCGGAFVAVNCAALPEQLLESELFGYEEGAFTGAKKGGKKGLFEIAHKGTIFLDEIGEIPPALQVRLLRVLQEKEVMRVGGQNIIPVDVRVIAATNLDLRQKVKEGCFRQDLYYRLNILQLNLPSLSERREDIPLLLKHLWQKHGLEHDRLLDDYMLPLLKDYPWPGNVREMENVVQRLKALINADFSVTEIVSILSENLEWHVEGDMFRPDFAGRTGHEMNDGHKDPAALDIHIKQLEKKRILKVLADVGGNRTLAAKQLGISRSSLWRKLRD
jgi:propionate catabolism operon transcriptional regulator